MITTLPAYICILMTLSAFYAFLAFYRASNNSKTVLVLSLAWLILQGIVSASEFYTYTFSTPPRFALLVAPPLILIVLQFCLPKGRAFIDSLDIKWLTALHIVRIPVELTLFLLFTQKLVPELMTFEGRNLDILSGLSACVVVYFGYIRNSMNKVWLIAWNFICLGLLFNIVINAILSVPTPFQKFAFEQPNIGILYFPFVWLPCFIVPLVLLAHLVSLRSLFRRSR